MVRFLGSKLYSIHPRSMGFGNTPVGLKFIPPFSEGILMNPSFFDNPLKIG